MKKFAFPLEKLRQYRSMLFEQEEGRLQELFSERAALEERRRQLDAEEQRTEAHIRSVTVVPLEELYAMDGFRRWVERQRQQLKTAERELIERTERQRQAVLEARHKVEALEKLKEKRLTHWTAEAARELEANVAELVVARWNRREQNDTD